MPRTYIISNNCPTYTDTPFCIQGSTRPNEHKFTGGVVVSLSNDRVRANDFYLKVDENKEKEFFLNIRSFPVSKRGRWINILTNEELEESRAESDDLLNIYIPIAKTDEDGRIVETTPLNNSFFFLKKGNVKPMSGFYEKGRVYMAGFTIVSPDSGPVDVIKNQEINVPNGLVVYLDFSGRLINETAANEVSTYDLFYLNSIGVSVGTYDAAKTTSDYYTIDSENDTRSKREHPLSFKFPIGMVVNSNFQTFFQGNVRLELGSLSFEYIIGTQEYAEDCIREKSETKTIYYITPREA